MALLEKFSAKLILKMHRAEYHFNREMIYKMKKSKEESQKNWHTVSFVCVMKLHRNIALGIISALEITLLEKRNARNTLKKLLKSNPNWGSTDRRIIAKVFYDIVRQKRLFEILTGDENSASNFWNLIGCWIVLNNQMLPKWDEFKDIDDIKIKSKIKTFHNERKYRYLSLIHIWRCRRRG